MLIRRTFKIISKKRMNGKITYFFSDNLVLLPFGLGYSDGSIRSIIANLFRIGIT